MKIQFSIKTCSIALMFILIGLNKTAPVNGQLSDADSRIRSVENHLRPALYVKGQTPPSLNIEDRMKFYNVPGVSVAVINEGKIEWAKGYGVKALGSDDPVTPETLFQAASISKPVSALGMLRLMEKGMIHLDTPVNEKLKSWKVPENEFTNKEPVTLRRLLTHSAGLNVHGFPGYPVSASVPTIIQILNGEMPANTEAVCVNTLPGSEWRYSGGGFAIAQLLTEDVTGERFSEYMQKNVLEPLGMSRSTFQQPLSSEKAALAASAHLRISGKVEGNWHVYPELAAAGLWTTPSDLCRFAIELQNASSGKPHSIISQETARKMLAPGTGGWGLGVGVAGSGDEETFSHGGGNVGFVCFLFSYVNRGQGAVVMTNSDSGDSLMEEIFRSISHVYGWSYMKPKEVALIEMDNAKLQAFTGDFRLAEMPDMPAIVSIQNGRLRIESAATGDWELLPVSEETFVYLDGGLFFTFIQSDDGRYGRLDIGPDDSTVIMSLTRKK